MHGPMNVKSEKKTGYLERQVFVFSKRNLNDVS